MSVYAHVAMGAALGSMAPGAGWAFVLGAASHVPADVVSHYDFSGWKVELALACAALALCVWFRGFNAAVILGALGAALPDAENLVAATGFVRTRRRLVPGHTRFLRHGGTRPAWDIALQFGVTAVMFGWLAWAPRFW